MPSATSGAELRLASNGRSVVRSSRASPRLGVHRDDLLDLGVSEPDLEAPKTDAGPPASLSQLMKSLQRDSHLLREFGVGRQTHSVARASGPGGRGQLGHQRRRSRPKHATSRRKAMSSNRPAARDESLSRHESDMNGTVSPVGPIAEIVPMPTTLMSREAPAAG